ncbi:MAG: hypothetical protein KIT08_00090 [Anaerolineales bacterium]|nr:MAG: hypothetical protein KIT08_00090 [Anaerolineales bacterium]
MNERAIVKLEQALLQAGRQLPYPITPDLAASAAERPRPALRLGWALGALLAMAASLLAVPDVRARVLEFLQVGSVQIALPPEGVSPVAWEPWSTGEYGQIVPLSELDGETTLEQAQAEMGFTFSLPAYPPSLGKPDRVYLQYVDQDPFAILLWMDEHTTPQLALYILAQGAFLSKTEPQTVQTLQVNGHPAALVIGSHLLRFGNDVGSGILVQAPALIWQVGELTYRLEGNLPLDELLRVAGSIQ